MPTLNLAQIQALHTNTTSVYNVYNVNPNADTSAILKGGEDTVDCDTVAYNRSAGNRLSNSRRGSTRTTRIENSELDEGFQPYHPPTAVSISENH